MDKELQRNLLIKSGVLKRSLKELQMYKLEVEKGEEKLKELGPEHDRYRQLQQALEESKSMILDTNNRLETAKEDLEELFERENLTEEYKDDKLCLEGVELISQANAMTV